MSPWLAFLALLSGAVPRDPVLLYSTYLGSGMNERAHAIAIDRQGNVYVGGETVAGAFPMGRHLPRKYRGRKESWGGGYDSVVAKLDPSGTYLEFATYLAGDHWDVVHAVAVDDRGYIYAVGHTSSSQFPIYNAFQKTNRGPRNAFGSGDAFVVKLDPTGLGLVYSTYLGGSHNDRARAVAVDASGNAYVVGFTLSDDFPVKNAAQPQRKIGEDGFAAKFDPEGRLVYSTYLSGSGHERATGIAVDASGCAYVVGATASADFPTLNAYQPQLKGRFDLFLGKLSPSGTLVYCTFFGGSDNEDLASVAVGQDGSVYIGGFTASHDLPVAKALQPRFAGAVGGGGDCFVARFNNTVTELLYSTYLGGIANDQLFGGIAVDSTGSVYLAGTTRSHDFPMAKPIQPALAGDNDGFISILAPDGQALTFSTFLGGSRHDTFHDVAVDPSGCVYLMGASKSKDFPTVHAMQPTKSGRGDFVVVKIGFTEEHKRAAAERAKLAATRRATRQWAVEDIAEEVEDVAPALAAVLEDKDQPGRSQVAWALGQMGSKAKAAVPALTNALRDEEAKVRWMAAVALVRIGEDARSAIPILIEAVKEPGGQLSRESAWAAWALGQMGSEAKSAVPALIEALQKKSGLMRSYLISALGKIGPDAKAAVPALTKALKDEDKRLRSAAGKALKKIRGVPATEKTK